ncbi:hypothetical protein [Sedimenticola hydrogenitrophicus]|uniref:hypothetical protein n=1 Tax=Sedimenticola hydrogenitrophicus TaxID=2967975 RepID=UPI0021A2E140|nr:hypothetical protein [Sedimenticola hydrogenitrophicus]
MKGIIIALALIAVGYYIYHNHSPFQTTVTDPYYAEIRINIRASNVQLVGFGKMNSLADCTARAALVWANTLKTLGEVEVKSDCKKEISARYRKLFVNEKIPASYIALDRGTDGERDARFIFYGIPSSYVSRECQTITQRIRQGYKGKVFCVQGSVS